MLRKQITIALACAGLICASTTSNTEKQNTTAKQPVLVARGAPQGGGSPSRTRGGAPGKPGGVKHGDPKDGKPVATA